MKFRCTILLCSLLLLCVTTTSAEEARSKPALKLRVSKALPVVGHKQTLTARILNPSSDPAEVVFQSAHKGKTTSIGQPQKVTASPENKETTTVAVEWTPSATGEYCLQAILKDAQGGAAHEASQCVTAVKRPLHFHYWHMDPSLKYVTEGLVQKEEPLEYWTDRGAVAQRWVGGIWAVKSAKRDTVDKLVQSWTSKQWPGIVIDEFGSPGKVDRLLAAALVETRKRMPELYLAPYAISPSEDAFEAFRTAADRVLIECYCPDGAHGYARIENRTAVARENGFLDKSLTVLGIGTALGKNAPVITTPTELQRQFHFLRYTFPEMSGAAFFSGFKPLYPTLNDAIRRFYVLPVLRVEEMSEGRVKVENIGADDAKPTKISLTGKTESVSVPALAVGQAVEVTVPRGAHPATAFRDTLTILARPLLWEEEPESNRPGASGPWPKTSGVNTVLEESFDSDSPRFRPDPPPENAAGDSSPAPLISLPFSPSGGKSGVLSFNLNMIRAGFYGGFQVGLTKKDGPDVLTINFYRGDYEPAVYAGLSLTNSEGVIVAERLALRLKSGVRYRIRCFFDGESRVRLGIWDAAGKKLWDTGNVPTWGAVTFDQLHVSVRRSEGSFIKWDSGSKKLHLRSELNKTYFSEGMLDDVKVEVGR